MADLPPQPGFTFTLGPPPEVLEYLKAKKLKPSFDYRDVWGEEHVGAFTVAKATTLDVLSTFHEAVIRAEAEGVSFGAFKKGLQPTLEGLGWWGIREQTDPKTGEKRLVQLGSPRRLQVIYRTNLATAHAAGRWERIERTQKSFPYLEYRLGPSVRHREQHAAWAGKVLPVDDPFWKKAFPPNGWGCKCWVRQLSKADLKGREPDPSPEFKYRPWKNERTGETIQVPVGIDPGWDYNPGKVRMQHLTQALAEKLRDAPAALATAAQSPIPLLTGDVVIARRLEAERGTNPGGLYQGKDGTRRYVKHYDDAAQSYGEAVAALAYRRLGLAAPDASVFIHKDKLSFAGRFIENKGGIGKVGLTKELANQVLDGFVADVWLANWDVVGKDLENIVVTDAGPARIDNGAALLFRAKAGRKPDDRLRVLSEWDGFASASRNPAYTKVFAAAGLRSADDLGRKAIRQIRAIQELGKATRAFEDIVPPLAAVPGADRQAILTMLRERARLLQDEIAPRLRAALAMPKRERELRAYLGEQYNDLLNGALERVENADGDRRGLTDAELVALHGYTGNGFAVINQALRGERDKATLLELRPYIQVIAAALDKLPSYEGLVQRGSSLGKDKARYQPGRIVRHKAFTSTSKGAGFNGRDKLSIASHAGKDVEWISDHENEREVLFKPGTRFRILERVERDGVTYIRMEEVP